MKKSLVTSIFSQHLKTFTKYLKNLWKREINDSADLWNLLIYISMDLVACIKLMHLFRIQFQMCVANRSFAYIMVRNLESNFIKIFNQSEDRNRSGGKRKDERQSKWSTKKHWKWSDREAQWKGDILFLIIYDGKYVLYFNNTRGVC